MLAAFSVYSCSPMVASSSSSNVQFGFQVRYVRIENLGTGDFWVRLNTSNPGATGTATTGHIHVGSCTDHRVKEFKFEAGQYPVALSLIATSTAAGTGWRAITAFGVG